MEQLTFKLESFEGPLDLLLTLIAKHKLDIYNIEISSLLEQYLDAIGGMPAQDLETSSEFLTMAARLVYIKTVSLLPVHEEGDELKKELEGQLLEYQLCKEVAERLRTHWRGDALFVRLPLPLPAEREYKRRHPPGALTEAYAALMSRARRRLPPPRTAFSGIVSRRMVSVESRIVYVLKQLYRTGSMSYGDFFSGGDRSEMVATFLAMLELIKTRRIHISEDNSTVQFNREFPLEDVPVLNNEWDGGEAAYGDE